MPASPSQDGQPAVGPDRPYARAARAELGLAADERRARRPAPAARRSPAPRRRRGRAQRRPRGSRGRARGLGQRRDAELALEHAHAVAVLLQRAPRGRRSAASSRISRRCAGSWSGSSVEPAARRGGSRPRRRPRPPRGRRAGRARPRARGAARRPGAAASRRSRAVAEREALEQVAAAERDRLLERAAAGVASAPARGTAGRRGPAMPVARAPTRSRVVSSCSSPMAWRRVESVRRSAPRACAVSWSGHRSSASASRAWARSASARYASSAVALRVSNETGAPSRTTRGGPSSDTVSVIRREHRTRRRP